MFGVAEDIDLSGLTGRTVEQLSAGLGRIEMGFDDEWQISIECSWTLTAEKLPPSSSGCRSLSLVFRSGVKPDQQAPQRDPREIDRDVARGVLGKIQKRGSGDDPAGPESNEPGHLMDLCL